MPLLNMSFLKKPIPKPWNSTQVLSDLLGELELEFSNSGPKARPKKPMESQHMSVEHGEDDFFLKTSINPLTGWWRLKYSYLFIFIPKIGEDEPILTHMFQHQLDKNLRI